MNLQIRRDVIKVAALLGAFIWVMDGVLDYLFFMEGSLLGLTFTNIPPHELYIRIFWFSGLLVIGIFASRLIDDREKALADKEELESLLRAVRNVNQLLVREEDEEKLIQRACEELIEARGYEHVWVALLDESRNLTAAAQEGVGEEFEELLERIEAGRSPACIKEPLADSKVFTVKDPSSTCKDCPLSESYKDH
ncbi:GAF domain-containing protein [Candidatus Bipolaricaulota bacterium]|nr:GAF domain-containing protein [Candidatus Bipolaricaulota bacterium]